MSTYRDMISSTMTYESKEQMQDSYDIMDEISELALELITKQTLQGEDYSDIDSLSAVDNQLNNIMNAIFN